LVQPSSHPPHQMSLIKFVELRKQLGELIDFRSVHPSKALNSASVLIKKKWMKVFACVWTIKH
jgi:hypothetical protein